MSAASRPFAPGDVFEGRYRIEEVLGRGGFGIVYGAADLSAPRRVAIKVLDAPATDHSARARFEREVAMVRGLTSPHTVRLFDSGITGAGELFAVFEHLDGRDLSDVLAEGQLEPAVVAHILEQLLLALREAHAAGLLHRDIKPENIRVLPVGADPWHVKLMDFGIARSTDGGHPSITRTGELIGTPRYMSPEQLTERELTAASDLYSLGIVAFEMLAGRDAVHGPAWHDQLDRLQTGFVVTGDTGPANSTQLSRMIAKMTARAPAARYATADAALHALNGTEPIGASTVHKARRPGPLAVGGALLVAVALMVLVIGDRAPDPIVVVRPRPDPQKLLKSAAPSPTHVSRDVAEDVDMSPIQLPRGCGKETPFTGQGRLRDGLDRVWDAYIPADYRGDRPLPLVVLLHDRYQDASQFLRGSGFLQLADSRGFAVIAPKSNPLDPWVDEETSLADALDGTFSQLCIDRSRVFVVGQGAGGRRAERLLCEPWVTAAAKNSYRKLKPRLAMCGRPAPFMTLDPNDSTRLPVKGGDNCSGSNKISRADELQVWTELYHCGDDVKTTVDLPAGRCQTWDCDVPLVSCGVAGGDLWPGTPPQYASCESGPMATFETAKHVWDFFERQEPLKIGCGGDPPFEGLGTYQGDLSEGWLTYAPRGYSSGVRHPLVVLLHQNMEPPKDLLRATGFMGLADEHGFLIVAPADNLAEPWKDNADMRRIQDVVTETTRGFCVDEQRIFIVGQGQGGRIAERLSCVSWVRGIATNSHRRDVGQPDDCARPVPHLILSPLHSHHEPADGGRSCTGAIKESIASIDARWRTRNKCHGAAESTFKHEGSECVTWSCETPFESCRVNGGHGWPGSNPRLQDIVQKCDGTPPDFPTAERIWGFLAETSGITAKDATE